VAAGTALTICVVDGSTHPFTLLGSGIVDPSVALTVNGKRSTAQFSLALLGTSASAFADLPRMFARARLFKPTWVGAWTFWLLLVALAATFGLAVAAVRTAAREDIADDPADLQRRSSGE
jgi:hypothetical protein